MAGTATDSAAALCGTQLWATAHPEVTRQSAHGGQGIERIALRIYPDTIIWNLLCDQAIDPKKLLDSLNAKGATLVASFHPVYELARNFDLHHPTRNPRKPVQHASTVGCHSNSRISLNLA